MSFSDNQLSKWANDYEKELCAKNDLICDRISLAITSGASEYHIPNYITNIRMVLWKGKEIYPKGFQFSIATGDSPFNSGSSLPYEYVVTGKGLRIIKFFPTPSETILEYLPILPANDLFTREADEVGVIIEFYRTPSPTDINIRLPGFIRRYLIKDYVCWKAFRNEGPLQDLRAASYYEERLGANQQYIGTIKDNMQQAITHVLDPYPLQRGGKPHSPVLPDNFPVRSRY